MIPLAAHGVMADPAVKWLVFFCAATFVMFTTYGGGFRTIPAYLADVFFGTRYVGGIHGRLLTAWSVAGLIGPLLITSLRERAIADAIDDPVARVDPAMYTMAGLLAVALVSNALMGPAAAKHHLAKEE